MRIEYIIVGLIIMLVILVIALKVGEGIVPGFSSFLDAMKKLFGIR